MSKRTIRVRCITANLQHSPKPEDNVVQYRFQQSVAPQGHPGDVFFESAFSLYFKPGEMKFEVGKEYELALEVELEAK